MHSLPRILGNTRFKFEIDEACALASMEGCILEDPELLEDHLGTEPFYNSVEGSSFVALRVAAFPAFGEILMRRTGCLRCILGHAISLHLL